MVCPWCKKLNSMEKHSIVRRSCGLEFILVQRLECKGCGRTFRVLPEFVVPYKTHATRTVEQVLTLWEETGNCYRITAATGIEKNVVKRWVRWWKIVEAVMKGSGLKDLSYDKGWLSHLLVRFPHWRSHVHCEASP